MRPRPIGVGVLLAALGASAVGCASVPLASAEQDTWAKTARAPGGFGSVYVYRNEYFGAAIMITIRMDGEVAGETAPNTYFRWDLPPGEHLLEAYTDITRDRSTLRINVTPGTSHYVWQEMKMGLYAGRPQLQEVDPTTGREAVGGCKLVHAFAAKPAQAPTVAAAPAPSAPAAAAAPSAPSAPAATRSLFDRLGGLASLTAIVDDTFARGGRDQRLSRWFAGRDLSQYKSAFVNQLCASSGGPCHPGASLATLYTELGLAGEQADPFLETLGDSLRHFRIGEGEERDVMSLFAGIRAPSASKTP
jgi:hypothetical protein